MARAGFILTKGAAVTGNPTIFVQSGNDGGAALAAAVAVLVADAATPTQAHVTTANAALPTVQGDFQLSYDTAKLTSVNHFKDAFAQLLIALRASGIPEV
jgi:autotransporter translocation and assembly factor TamB